MATVVVTIAAGGEAGATIRRFGEAVQQAAMLLPDRNPTGASVTMTIDNGPATGTVSVAVAGGGLAATQTVIV
jgi:hypothetical protein